jgi:hypothetical protein
MKSTSHSIALLLRTVVAGVLALQCQCALATDAATDDQGAAPTTTSSPAPAAMALTQSFRGPGTGGAATKAPSQPRLGMHVVARLAVVDLIAHPDSGDVRLALRSKLLKGSIAKSQLAVAVTWRF